ncbi:craniofacial development protein 2-like [Sipha flava]|uniref:Craniofacial development protein 2-like n=1 Tax=Sipha flava TaxID=143950 RepID=A0A8B8FLA6_9HEMI|nr:craniofacial development protein 2-like [Sipha flava]
MPRISGLQDSRLENWKSALRFELRWNETGSMQLKNTTLLYGARDNRRLGESGFAVNKAFLNSVKDFKVISPRMTVLMIAARWFNIAFCYIHAPMEEKKEVEKDEFYSLLNNVLNDIPANCIQIILGDFNAKIGKENYFRPIIGIHDLHEVSNDNGCR